MKKSRVIHPFLFAIFPIVFLFSQNIAEISIIDRSSIVRIVIPTAITLCCTFSLWLLLNVIFKNKTKTGVWLSMFLIMFFSYGHLYTLFHDFYFNVLASQLGIDIRFAVGGLQLGHYKIFFSLWVILWSVLFVLVTWSLRRTRRNLAMLTRFLNITASTLVIISLVNIVLYETRRLVLPKDRNTELFEIEPNLPNETTINTFPDIYYIILDEYGAASTLKEAYHYDNQEFLNYLQEKGFYIASQSRSNYAFTFFSLASSLNMEYVNYLTDTIGRESGDLRVPIQMVENNKVMRFLKSRGYKFIHLRSDHRPTLRNKYADRDIACGDKFVGEGFVKMLIQTTMIGFLNRPLISHRETILCQFSMLPQLHKIKEPIFAFAHIVAPHSPYVFGANGEEISEEERRTTTSQDLYLNQIIFLNKKVKALVDELLSQSEHPPIIILQADTGPPWSHVSKDTRMGILNAYYLPQGGSARLYDSITPVNTFRLIFNFYFNTSYELLDDRSYYSEHWKFPYKFIDVTDRGN